MKKILLNPRDNVIASVLLAVVFMTMLTEVFGIDGIGRFVGGAAIIGIVKLITARIKAKEAAAAGDTTEGTHNQDLQS